MTSNITPLTSPGNPGSHSMSPQTATQKDSPTSTISEGVLTSAIKFDQSRSSLRNLSSSVSTPRRKPPMARFDSSMLTSFDPADKELYDLWAPKR